MPNDSIKCFPVAAGSKKRVSLAVTMFFLLCFLAMGSIAQNPAIRIKKPSNGKGGFDNPGEAALFEIERTKDVATGWVPRELLMPAINKTRQSKEARANLRALAGLTWTERGPNGDVVGASNGNTRPGAAITSGRMRALWVDLTDATGNTVWVGGADGGLWKTSNITATPASWTLVNDYLSNLAVTSICQDPVNTNIMYFCTGEAFFNADAVNGNGVFKSTDFGATWTLLPSTSTYLSNSKIMCDASGNVYLGVVGTGLLRSTNQGSTWTNINPTGLSTRIADFEISSTGRMHVSCGLGNTTLGGYRFTNTPATVTSGTWTTATTPFSFPSGANTRLELACSGNTLYALPSNTLAKVTSVYKSIDGGVTWTTLTLTTTNQNDYNGTGSSGQAWYCLAIDIDPSNANNVIIGNLNLLKTTNGGTSWSKISEWVGTTGQYVHADQHIIKWYANGNKLLIGSDGGIHYSADKGVTITDKNLGLRIKQFYSCAIHPTSTNYFLAGAQDNGTHQLNTVGMGSSVEVTGGDGAYVAIDQNQGQYQFGSYVYNTYRRSITSGTSWSSCNFYKGTSATASNFGSFINPYAYDNINNIIYAAADAGEFFRWTTAQTTAAGNYFLSDGFPSGASVVTGITAFNGAKVSAVHVSPYTTNLVYFGTAGGRVVKISNANTAPNSTAGTNISGAGFPAGTVSCINTGTGDLNLIASFSNYSTSNVWVTTDGGTNWVAVDGNLPDMPVRWCMFYPGNNTKAFIATETGVWETDLLNGASTVWSANPTFPVVRTDMLQYRSSDGTIAAATHGRGLFTAIIPVCPSPPVISINPSASSICKPGGAAVTLTASGGLTYSWSPATGLSATTGATVTANPSSTTTYSVTGTDGGGCTGIASSLITVADKPVLSPTVTPATICSGNNSILNANATLPVATYCIPTYSSGTGFGDYISLVQLPSTTLNNSTAGAATPYFTLFPAAGSTTGTLVTNTPYTLSVRGGTYAECYIRAWIDFNQDGQFNASESIGISPNVGSSTIGTIVFNISPLAAINGTTRMRLRSSDTGPGPDAADFCAATNSAYGETEDYVVTITGGTAPFTYAWTPATFLSGTDTNPITASAVTTTTMYNVLVTAPNGCSSTGSVTVNVNALPPVNFSGLAGNYCTTGTSVTLTGSPTGGTFSGPGISGSSFSPGTAGAGTHTITYNYTDGNGCSNAATQQTTVSVCPTFTILNLKVFLEGFYIGGSLMRATLYDLGLSSDPTATDHITVNLWSPLNLSNSTPDHSISTILHSNGTASIQFPAGVSGNSWYIVVVHRSSLETWSKSPVVFTGSTNYDFSIALNKAFDDGILPPMKSVGGGIYAIYGGDITQDGTIDVSDMVEVDNDASVGAFGYNMTDCTGDGGTDLSDMIVIDNNAQLALFYARPY